MFIYMLKTKKEYLDIQIQSEIYKKGKQGMKKKIV